MAVYWKDIDNQNLVTALVTKDKLEANRLLAKLYPKLKKIATVIYNKYFITNFKKEDADFYITEAVTDVYLKLTKSNIVTEGNGFSYVTTMFKNYYIDKLRLSGKSPRENVDVFKKDKAIVDVDNFIGYDIRDNSDDDDNRERDRLRIIDLLLNLIPEYIDKNTKGLPKMIKYLSLAIDFLELCSDNRDYTLGDINEYIFNNSDLTQCEVENRSLQIFNKKGQWVYAEYKEVEQINTKHPYKLIVMLEKN